MKSSSVQWFILMAVCGFGCGVPPSPESRQQGESPQMVGQNVQGLRSASVSDIEACPGLVDSGSLSQECETLSPPEEPQPTAATASCAGRSYDPTFYICCNGVISFKGSNNACCGTAPYNTTFDICCNGKLSFKGSSNACCGTAPYNTTFDICCNGKLSFKGSNNACCGTAPYNTTFDICCSGKISFKGSNNACCGTVPFNTTFDRCCPGNIVRSRC